MIPVHVTRWHSHYTAEQPLPAGQIEAFESGLAQVDIGVAPAPTLDDEWICIRRLRLSSRLFAGDGATQASAALREALLSSLTTMLRDGPADMVVRYRTRRDGVADMLYRAAVGDLRRAWAWRQMGLATGSASAAAPAPLLHGAVRQLVADPEAVWPVLGRLLMADPATGGFTALVRHVAEEDWDVLLDACPQTRAFHRIVAPRLDPATASGTVLPVTDLSRLLVAWIARHEWQARPRRRQLIVLLAASSTPAGAAAIGSAAVAAALGVARDAFDRHGGHTDPVPRTIRTDVGRAIAGSNGRRALQSRTPTYPHGQPEDSPDIPDGAAPAGLLSEIDARPASPVAPERDPPPAPALPSIERRLPTEWAGLLFLIHLVPETGLLEEFELLHAAEAKSPWHLAHVLRWVAVEHFQVPADDPAVLAFCGGQMPAGDAGDRQGDEGIRAFARRAAAVLRTRLVERLGIAGDAAGTAVIESVCRRSGFIVFEPGWIEVHLTARSAEVSIRRAALDLDPGWVAWLGTVVRFVYE